jgi:LysM repeat protein
MKLFVLGSIALFIGSTVFAQTFAPTPAMTPADSSQLQTLIKKLDEQNAKIDMLSQQILKLEQQIANMRPGVMVGESTPAPTAATASTTATTSAQPANGGSTHTVARGETLTSIAKAHGVSISDLQKYNHIENPLKLQAGQTIMIPASPSPGSSPSATPE